MNLTFHLVRTDLRRLWLWVAFIAAVVVTMNAIGFWIVTFLPLDSEHHVAVALTRIGASLEYLRLAGVLAGYIFVILLVQGDRTIGTAPFWLTRPISGIRLFTAKVLTIGLVLVVFPVILSLPWWGWCGFGWREMAIASAEFGVVALGLGCPAVFIGVLTDSLSRAFIWGSLIVLLTLSLVFAAAMSGQVMGLDTISGVTAHVPNTVVSVALLLLTMAGVAAVQYVWRRPVASFAVLGIGVGVALNANVPTVPLALRLATREHHAVVADAIQVKFVQGSTSIVGSPGQQWGKLSVALEPSECPPGRVVMAGVAVQTWAWPATPNIGRLANTEPRGNLVARSLRAAGYHSPLVDAETVAWRKMRSEAMYEKFIRDARTERQANEWRMRLKKERQYILRLESQETERPDLPENSTVVLNTVVPLSVAVRLRTDPVHYDARVTLSLLRPDFVDVMPVQASTWHAERGRGLKAVRVESKQTPTLFALIYTDPENWTNWLLGAPSTEYLRRTIVMLSPVKHEVFGANVPSGPKLTVNSVSIAYGKTEFGAYVIRNGKYLAQPPPEGAVLARLTCEEEARFTRTVEVDKFVANAPEADAAQPQ
jgi:hypothetical protein